MNTIATAQREYFKRPADERFPSLDALVQHAITEKAHSTERVFNVKDLTAVTSDDGDLMLRSPNGHAARFSHWSFSQFARTLGAPAGYLREQLNPELAAQCLNYGISQTPPATDVNLMLRTPNGKPEPVIRAATSKKYGRAWDAEIYGAISQTIAGRDGWSLPPTWDGKPAGAYSGDRDSFLILCNGGSIVTDPSLSGGPGDGGQMFRGLLIRNSEVGASSLVIDQILYRYVCGNHMLWGAVIDKRFARRHVGANVTRDAVREIGRIAHAWVNQTDDRDEQIIRRLIAAELASTREGVIDELKAIGFTKDDAEAAYAKAEGTENASPRSYWGIAQGATRISQETEYQDGRYELDKLAALVLARGARKVAA